MEAISIGEVLWDVIGSDEHLGGAPLNFAIHLKNLGHRVHLVSAVGTDRRGREVLERLQQLGLSTRHLSQIDGVPTGVASVELDEAGQPRFVIHHPAAYDFPALPKADISQLCSLSPGLIYFGTLFQMSAPAREVTMTLLKECPPGRRFYDLNLRADSYSPDLIREMMSHATVVKLNQEEVRIATELFGGDAEPLEHFCRAYAKKFGWEAVCVTRGSQGCVLLVGDDFVLSEGYKVPVADTVGAGDAFAAAFAHGLVNGWEPPRIADFANRVGALVASRPGATPACTIEEALALHRDKGHGFPVYRRDL